MSTDIDRAAALLFPVCGRRALDVKFFFVPGASVSALARQIVVCFDAMNDEGRTISNVDQGLTV